MMDGARFKCIRHEDGTWMVWDVAAGAPAQIGGCMLSGRPRQRAEAAAEILERIYKNRLDRRGVGKTPLSQFLQIG